MRIVKLMRCSVAYRQLHRAENPAPGSDSPESIWNPSCTQHLLESTSGRAIRGKPLRHRTMQPSLNRMRELLGFSACSTFSRREETNSSPFRCSPSPPKAEIGLTRFNTPGSTQPEISHQAAGDVRSFLRKYLVGSAKADAESRGQILSCAKSSSTGPFGR